MNGPEMESICFQFISIWREIFHMLDVEEVMCPLPAVYSRGSVPEWHLEMLGCVTSQSLSDGRQIWHSFPFSCWWWQTLFSVWGMGEGKGYAFRGIDADSCPRLSFVFKSERLVGVAQTITQLEGSSEAPGNSEQAQRNMGLEETL